MSQRKFLEDAMRLASIHPKAAIKVCADGSEIIPDFGWTAHEIVQVRFCKWIVVNDCFYTDEDTAKDEISEMLFDRNAKGVSDEEWAARVDDYFAQHAIDAICIFTGAES